MKLNLAYAVMTILLLTQGCSDSPTGVGNSGTVKKRLDRLSLQGYPVGRPVKSRLFFPLGSCNEKRRENL